MHRPHLHHFFRKIVAYKAGFKKQTGVIVASTGGSNVFHGALVLGIVYPVEGRAEYSYQDKRGSLTAS